MTLRQAQWSDDGIGLADVEPPTLVEGWARLRVAACGICGSDLHMLRHHMMRFPGASPGHEIVGTPTHGPSGLADALYAVEPRSWCGHCGFCAQGQRQLCPSGKLLGVTAPGGLADFVDAPLAGLHRVPSGIDPLLASLAEPLAVCVRALDVARLEAGSRVLVLGAGSIGLLAGLLARDRSAAVALSARHPQQRAAAAKLGLVALPEADMAAWASAEQPDVVIETVGGLADTANDALRACRPGGTVVLLGVFAEPRPLELFMLMAKELRVVGSNTYGTGRSGSEFGTAVALLPRYAGELSGLQTHQFPLARIGEAFACAADKASGAIKVTLLP